MTGRRLASGALAVFVLTCVPGLMVAGQGPAPTPVDLSGTWAELQVCSQMDVLPILGRVTSTSTSLLCATIEQSGNSLLMREVTCSTTIATGSPFGKLVIPEAFLVSLGEMTRPASLDGSGPTIRFDQPWFTQVRGAHLLDPENDALPTSPADPRVFDQDGDGKPGLTVRVSILGFLSGEVYVVQRVRYRMIGTVVSLDRVEGLIEWSNEQITIDASDPLFVTDTRQTPNPAREKSYFVLRKVDPDTTCQTIVARRKALFGR